jgi:hypothetical protein
VPTLQEPAATSEMARRRAHGPAQRRRSRDRKDGLDALDRIPVACFSLRLRLLSHSQMVTSGSCSKTQAVAKAMSQQEKKPRDEKHADHLPQADASLDDPEVRDTIAAGREALQKSAEEIERAKRLLRETEELQPLPGSQPDKKAI